MWTKSDDDLIEQGKRELAAARARRRVEGRGRLRGADAEGVPGLRRALQGQRRDRCAAGSREHARTCIPSAATACTSTTTRTTRCCTAMLSVENIFGAHHDVWSVNVEDRVPRGARRRRGRREHQRRRGTGRDAPVLPRSAIDAAAEARRGATAPDAHPGLHAHLHRGGEHRGVPASAPAPRCPTPTSSSSTTTAPTAPPTSPTRSARSSARSRCCAGPEKIGIGDAVPRRLRGRASHRGYDVIVPDRRRPVARSRRCCPSSSPRSRRGADLAIGSRYVPGGVDPALAVAPAGGVEVRQPLRHARARHPESATRPSGYRAFRADTAQGGRLRATRAPRATASRSSSRTASAQHGGRSSRCRSRSPTACAATRRCRWR